MAGSVDHMSITEARRTITSDQSRLTTFGNGASDTTYIGIVNSADEDFEATVDEIDHRLAPPDELFYQWLRTKRELEQNGTPSTAAHNKAIEAVDYRERLGRHLEELEQQMALSELTGRVVSGENIVLVCYCNGGKWCHREPVSETIDAMVSEEISQIADESSEG